MKRSSYLLGAAGLMAVSWMTSCAEVKPAGALGYHLHGDTRLRPVPTDYLHVPPKMEERGPLQFQMGF